MNYLSTSNIPSYISSTPAVGPHSDRPTLSNVPRTTITPPNPSILLSVEMNTQPHIKKEHSNGAPEKPKKKRSKNASKKPSLSSSPPLLSQSPTDESEMKDGSLKPLSTSSPVGIAAASMVTSNRLANLLIRNGPLPIRHITTELSQQISGFHKLSLSKQRRLIMAVFETVDPITNCCFEKVGWGQWAARRVDSDFIEGKKELNINEIKNSSPKLGWTKRRESITNASNNPHNTKVPGEHIASPLSRSFTKQRMLSLDEAIDSSSEGEDDDDEDEDDGLREGAIESDSDSDIEEDDEVFPFDADDEQFAPPMKFARRVPLKLTPPPMVSSQRRKSSFNSNGINKPKIRSRLNSIDNLEIVSDQIRRSSFTTFSNRQSSIRSTLSSSTSPTLLPTANPIPSSIHATLEEDNTITNHHSDTDEEDWESIGANALRSNSHFEPVFNSSDNIGPLEDVKTREEAAAFALVDLRSI